MNDFRSAMSLFVCIFHLFYYKLVWSRCTSGSWGNCNERSLLHIINKLKYKLFLLCRKEAPFWKQFLLIFWKFHFRSFWEELCKAYSEWVADDLQCADTRKRIAVEHIWNGGYGKPRLFRKTVFAPSMALHQFCYALFYVHQIHLLIILYVSTEKKIVAKSIVFMSQMGYIDSTKAKEGILRYHIVRRNCVLGRWCGISIGQAAFGETGPLDSNRPYSSRKAHYT